MVQAATWADFAIDAVKILGPAAISALVTWLALRSQKELKRVEVEGQTKLKARELMFNAYQQQAEQHYKDMKDIGATLGKLGVALQVESDPDERNQLLAALMETLGSLIIPIRPVIGDMEEGLRAAGLLDKYRPHLEYIRRISNTDLMKVPLDEVPSKYQEVMTALSYGSLIQNVLIEYKRTELFGEYLPRPDLRTLEVIKIRPENVQSPGGAKESQP